MKDAIVADAIVANDIVQDAIVLGENLCYSRPALERDVF